VTHHNASRVLSTSFSYGPSDQSAMRRRVERHSPVFVDLGEVGAADAAVRTIESHDIDILVDLTVLTFNSRLDIPAQKPAALVINYLGFPGPSGCQSFDYALVDCIAAPPETSRGFGERLLYMPSAVHPTGGRRKMIGLRSVYQGNDMPLHVPATCASCSALGGEGGECSSSSSGAAAICRRELFSSAVSAGLAVSADNALYERIIDHADQYLALCSFNANKKLEPISFTGTLIGRQTYIAELVIDIHFIMSVWLNVLRRVPNAILVMLSGGKPSQQRLMAEAAAAGVHFSRIVYLKKVCNLGGDRVVVAFLTLLCQAGWEKHLQRATGCDLVLDTFVYGAHTTAADMLWQGVPTLTIAGVHTYFAYSYLYQAYLNGPLVGWLAGCLGAGWGGGRMPSRVAAALLGSLGGSAPLLVAHSSTEYEDLAVRCSQELCCIVRD
jgi:hypothetical protein